MTWIAKSASVEVAEMHLEAYLLRWLLARYPSEAWAWPNVAHTAKCLKRAAGSYAERAIDRYPEAAQCLGLLKEELSVVSDQ